MYPQNLLKAAEGKGVLVELKNGDTYHGTLVDCDKYLNLNLKDITLTASDGERFWKLSESYIRGTCIKYFRLDPDVLQAAADNYEAQLAKRRTWEQNRGRGAYRGGRGDRDNSYGRGGRGGDGRGARGGRGGDGRGARGGRGGDGRGARGGRGGDGRGARGGRGGSGRGV